MKCNQCGHEFVSTDQAPSCPRCGNPVVFDSAGSRDEDVNAPSLSGRSPGDERPRGERTESPWEMRESLFDVGALLETVKGVLIEPVEFFATLKTTGDTTSPTIFFVILGTLSALVGLVWNLLFQSMSFMQSQKALIETGLTVGVLVVIAVMSPLLMLVGAYIMAGILHLGLMIVGGAKKDFEATFRTVAYCYGSTALLGLVPVCGGMVAVVWNIVVTVIGLREMHEIETGKALLAVFLPLILCCGCIMLPLVLGLGAMFTTMLPELQNFRFP